MEIHLLVTISEKQDNLFGVRSVGSFFEEKKEMKIKLFYLTARPTVRFEEDSEREQRTKKSETTGRKALKRAKNELMKKGFVDAQIFTKLRASKFNKEDEIINEGSEGKYDAVVLGRRGISRLEERFAGSVTNALFEKEWDFPLWICRNPDTTRKNVLACVDGSEDSHRMLKHVGFILGQADHQNVTLLTIPKKGTVEEDSADAVLQKGKRILLDAGILSDRIQFQIIPETDVAKAIIKEASAGHYAAVAVGRAGRIMGFLQKVFIGSVSRALLQEIEGACLWMA
jgi:nucleotide-binding universal stress UspA family protein